MVIDMQIEILDKDNETLSALISECFKHEVENIDIQDALSNNVRFLCALINDNVIGCIMITTKYNPVKRNKEFYLDYVCVKESEREKGVAKMLLDKAEEMAKEEGIAKITFTSSSTRIAARNLYISSGYIIRDTDVFYKDMVI